MLQVGYSEIDITPVNGEDLCGFALREGPTQSPHDPLMCRWLTLSDDEGHKVLLGCCDLIGLSRGTFREICDRILQRHPGVSVALATTHTHSGPATVTLRHCGRMSGSYMSHLKDKIVDAATQALGSDTDEVRVKIGSTICDWAYNRRDENGPVDHELLVLGLETVSGKPVATIVNYACHPVVLGHRSNAVSADYPGYLTAYIAKETGAPCIFLNGACGDLNPVNNHSTEADQARKAGETIGAKAIEALATATLVERSTVHWYKKNVSIPVHQPASAGELELRLDMLQERFGLSRSLFTDRITRDIRLLAEEKFPKSVAVELSLLTLGDEVAIMFVPGELFSSIGLQIKAMMPSGKLLISGFSNGSVGYLCDRQAYEDGGYEPYFANFFYDFPEFEPSVEDAILAGAQALLAKAKLWEPIESGNSL